MMDNIIPLLKDGKLRLNTLPNTVFDPGNTALDSKIAQPSIPIIQDTSKFTSSLQPDVQIVYNKTDMANYNNHIFAKKEEVSDMLDGNDFTKYVDLLDKDRRDMENRLTDERKESEKRITKYIDNMNEKFDVLSNKIDEQKKDSARANREQRGWSIATIISIIGLTLAAFYGTAQIVIAIVQALHK